jgi:hypothetical protein
VWKTASVNRQRPCEKNVQSRADLPDQSSARCRNTEAAIRMKQENQRTPATQKDTKDDIIRKALMRMGRMKEFGSRRREGSEVIIVSTS